MMKAEKQHLLNDLQGDGRREDTLRAGAAILRRRRWMRAAGQIGGAVAALALGVFLAQSVVWRQEAPVAIAPMAKPEAKVHYLTDEELLAMFPNTPVALVKAGDKEQLFFLNPADEKRYVAKM
jgi:hypothetical protein